MKKITYLLFLLPFAPKAQGIWLPLLLEKENEKEMKSLGLKLKADDIYSPVEASLKDAICQFDGGCTGEMISAEGLLLTNHHCGFEAIQSLSTLENNYIENGYWARDRKGEMPANGVTAMFVVRMEDVTPQVLRGIMDNMGEKDRQAQIDKNIQQLRNATRKEAWQEILIRPFYNGNQYYLFITETFKDVRFVGAPPSAIGKFGADTDNWVWPRHTGDFSMFRVYANKDNHPAEYAADNQPYKPKKHLSISLDGVDEGDFTMVYGFPGRTDEYLTEAAVRLNGEVLDPARVSVRDRALKIMDGYMRKDPATKIAYIAKYATIANGWKKWLGEMQGLKAYKAYDKKRAYEADFEARIKTNPDWNLRYAQLLPRLRQLHKDIEPYAFARDYYLETCLRNNELFSVVSSLSSWLDTYEKNGETFFASKQKESAENVQSQYKDYKPEVAEALFAALLEMYASNTNEAWGAGLVKAEAEKAGGYAAFAAQLYKNSVYPSKEKMDALMQQKPALVYETLKKDPAYVLWKKLDDAYKSNIQPKIQEIQPQINLLQREYMAAQMKIFKDKHFFPDANSTLRLTYGNVRSFSPRDAVKYEYSTDLDGVMEKYIPGDYEFDVPKRLIELWRAKDYGRYANADGQLPVAFIGTNHTTGGNSGSPALDAKGNLIGLNFDRVWEGTMSDLNFEPAICRNIMVDVRYVLFIIDKYAGANNLIEEMDLVKGKKKKKR